MNDYISSREIGDLLESLKKHLNLLESFCVEAFKKQNDDFFGEIAAKIRLLTISFKSNKPLLIGLMKKFEIEPAQIFDGPPVQYPNDHPKPGDSYTLEVFLTMPSMGFKTKSEGFKMLNKTEFICLFAEKHGAAHEDWNHPEILRIIKDANIFIGNEQIYINELRGGS